MSNAVHTHDFIRDLWRDRDWAGYAAVVLILPLVYFIMWAVRKSVLDETTRNR